MTAMDNAHALVIGIANYQSINKLSSTVLKDAQDIYDALANPNLCVYPPSNVTAQPDGTA
jgi:hypothetical protein